MKLKQAVEICKLSNQWRRYDGEIGKGPKMPDPKKFGIAIDILIKHAEG